MIAQIINTLVGLWLMVVPSVIVLPDTVKAVCFVLGPLIASVGYIAIWDPMRLVRWVNVVLGLVLFSSLFWESMSAQAMWHLGVISVVIVLMACQRGRQRYSYAGGWTMLMRPKLKEKI